MASGTRPRRPPWKLLLAAAAVALLFAAWRVLPLQAWLNAFGERVRGMGPAGGLLYGAVYVLAVLLFVPGIVLTLGAGFLFGVAWGTVIVSLASTTAAAFAFLIARYFARSRVERLARRNPKFQAIDRAIGEQGWKVVALLRLSPLVPFSISNYIYGLTSVRFLPYVAASWIAMLPATVLYVSLGAAGQSLERGRARSPWEWVLLGAGILATAAITLVLTRVARRELRRTSRAET